MHYTKRRKMGIKHLNRFLRENCTAKSVRKVHLKTFANKSVVIDTSIYLYKFLGEESLFESMYLFISILKSYNITPIFIFDGKPPPEKQPLLIQRFLAKKDAESKYHALQSELNENEKLNDDEKREIILEMNVLRRQFIRVRDEDVYSMKKLMDSYGVAYYDAPSEADLLCAYFIKIGKADVCFSDDMDMFLYGCNIVARNISLLNHTVTLYNADNILEELKLSYKHFCEIVILSGTDYDISNETSLIETVKWFREYKKYIDISNKKNMMYLEFYVWLFKYTKYIKDFHKLLRTYQMFQINPFVDLEYWRDANTIVKPYDELKLRSIMENEGFVFA